MGNQAERLTLAFASNWIAHIGKGDSVEGIENVPTTGSAIIMINHISFIDPFVVANPLHRNLVALAKVEVYDYPIIGIIPKLLGVIPVKRDEVDRNAVQSCLEVLRAGEMILLAPEGTRGPILRQGLEGVAYLASRSGAPVVPVAMDGTDGFPALRLHEALAAAGGADTLWPAFSLQSRLASGKGPYATPDDG